jgi:hypothetical protein
MKDGQIQIRTHKIISKGDHFPTKKSIKFTEKQMPPESVINIKLSYLPEEAPHLKNTIIQAYEIHLPKVNSEKFEFVLHFVMDQNGVPFIERGNLNEIWYEDAPVDKKVDGKEKTENKDSKILSINHTISSCHVTDNYCKLKDAVIVWTNEVIKNYANNKNSN